MSKLKSEHRHILRLIVEERDEDGFAKVSEALLPVLSKNMPSELIEFEALDTGGKARLTKQGEAVYSAMEWL